MKKASKFFDFEFSDVTKTKDASGALKITGYANTIHRDRVGDIILPKAFEKFLPAYKENPIILYMHNWEEVIGKVLELEITETGLKITAFISGASDCEDVRKKIVEGILKTLSIGYNEVESSYDEPTQTKTVSVVELLEISIVSIPCNTQSTFTVVDESKNAKNSNQGVKDMKKQNPEAVEPQVQPEVTPEAKPEPTPEATPATEPTPEGEKAKQEPEQAPDEQGKLVVELLQGIHSALKEILVGIQAMKPAEATPEPTPEPEAEPEKSANESENTKKFEDMTADEQASIISELETITEELEELL